MKTSKKNFATGTGTYDAFKNAKCKCKSFASCAFHHQFRTSHYYYFAENYRSQSGSLSIQDEKEK